MTSVERARKMAEDMGVDLTNLHDDINRDRLVPKTIEGMKETMGWSEEHAQLVYTALKTEGLITSTTQENGEELIEITEEGLEVILVMERIAFALMPVEGGTQ